MLSIAIGPEWSPVESSCLPGADELLVLSSGAERAAFSGDGLARIRRACMALVSTWARFRRQS